VSFKLLFIAIFVTWYFDKHCD